MKSCFIVKNKKNGKEEELFKKKIKYLTLERYSEKTIFNNKNKTLKLKSKQNSKDKKQISFNQSHKHKNKNGINVKNMNPNLNLLEISNTKINNILNNYLTIANSTDKCIKKKYLNNNDNLGKYSKDSNLDSFTLNNYSTKVYDKGKNKKSISNKKNNLTCQNFYKRSINSSNTMKNSNYSFIGQNLMKIKKITNKYIKTINSQKVNFIERNKKNIKEQVMKKNYLKTQTNLRHKYKYKNNDNNKGNNKDNIKDNKKHKENFLSNNKIEKQKVNGIRKKKKNLKLNNKYNIFNNVNNAIYSDRKAAPSSREKTSHSNNNTLLNSKTYKTYKTNLTNKIINTNVINNILYPSKKNILRNSFKSKNEIFSLDITNNNHKKYALTQTKKIKYKKPENYQQLVYKTEFNLNKELLDDESILNKNESKEMSLRKYRYYSPVNVQRKIFSFKKNELIDITNKNNYIVIIKRKCKSINKKYNFGKKGIEINYDENNKRLFENKLNSYITPKNLIMISGKMKETSMINKPKENLELKLFNHKRRNSVM